jgi:alkylhydroperoxidase/carboxymuconolactone decarboxylase family protein YurZ
MQLASTYNRCDSSAVHHSPIFFPMPPAKPPRPPDELDAVRARVADIRQRRGYVLPSHAALAVADPVLLEQYEGVYNTITFGFQALTPFEKNFVWLVVVGCAETPTGAAHLSDFLAAGGTRPQVEAAAQLALVAIGARMLDVFGPGWQRVLADFDADAAYAAAIDRIVSGTGLAAELVEIALAAGQACRRDWKRVEFHIVRAKQLDVGDDALAEGLTVCILPAGNPGFVQACATWRRLVAEGKVDASPALRAAVDAL